MEQAASEKPEQKGTNKKDIESGKSMAILAYIIAPIPYFTEKNNKFVRYHAIQGMNIFIIALGYSIAASIVINILGGILMGGCFNWWTGWGGGGMCETGLFSFLSLVIWAPAVVIGVLDIMALISASQGLEKEVPIIGKFKIIKK